MADPTLLALPDPFATPNESVTYVDTQVEALRAIVNEAHITGDFTDAADFTALLEQHLTRNAPPWQLAQLVALCISLLAIERDGDAYPGTTPAEEPS